MRFDDLIVWHPYPAEKPTECKEYLITKRYDGSDDTHVVYEVEYSPKYDRWNFSDCLNPKKHVLQDSFTPNVTAWAEMPQVTPYEG